MINKMKLKTTFLLQCLERANGSTFNGLAHSLAFQRAQFFTGIQSECKEKENSIEAHRTTSWILEKFSYPIRKTRTI